MLLIPASLLTLAVLTLPTSGDALPPSKSRKSFTPKLSGEGYSTLASNLQFLCSLNPLESGRSARNGDSENINWIQIILDSTLEKVVKPGESLKEQNMKRALAENILANAISNCEEDLEYQDQPSDKVARPPAESNYVENILQNIFSGNIRGIIRSYYPNNMVSSTVSDVWRSLLTNISSVRSRIGTYSFRSNSTTPGTTSAKPYDY